MRETPRGAGSAIIKLGKAHVVLLLDASPSMDDPPPNSLRDPAIRGVNDQVAALRATTSTAAGVSLLQFSDETRPSYVDVDLGRVKKRTRAEYDPNRGNGTALYDGVHAAIDLLEPKVRDDETALVVVVTDGQENSSRRDYVGELAVRIKAKQLTGRWTFVLLGPRATARATAEKMAIPVGNVQTFEAKPLSLEAGFDETRRGIGRYMDARSRGVGGTDGFYLPSKDD